jgi:hypothetical protein
LSCLFGAINWYGSDCRKKADILPKQSNNRTRHYLLFRQTPRPVDRRHVCRLIFIKLTVTPSVDDSQENSEFPLRCSSQKQFEKLASASLLSTTLYSIKMGLADTESPDLVFLAA